MQRLKTAIQNKTNPNRNCIDACTTPFTVIEIYTSSKTPLAAHKTSSADNILHRTTVDPFSSQHDYARLNIFNLALPFPVKTTKKFHSLNRIFLIHYTYIYINDTLQTRSFSRDSTYLYIRAFFDSSPRR